tara:strand:- start:10980 stop:11345 length:366 start_codon:yes stop_codon:yes gene_type:complete
MYKINNAQYNLLLSFDPCEIFEYFSVTKLHGLSLVECMEYNNTSEDAYIAGLCNVSPNTGKRFIFINLSRCTDDFHTMGLAMHETMHLGFSLLSEEEEIITFAEVEAYRISGVITSIINKK